MLNRLTYILAALHLTLLPGLSLSSSVERFNVDNTADTSYLQYRLESIHSLSRVGEGRPVIQRPYHVLTSPQTDTATVDLWLDAYNPLPDKHEPAILSFRYYPDMDHATDVSVDLTLTDCAVAALPNDVPVVVACGWRDDTIWVCRIDPYSDSPRGPMLPLLTGQDRTGDGVWQAGAIVVLVEDYDFDGVEESFVYAAAGRDLTPRELICIQVEPFEIEWSLPVASHIAHAHCLSLRDSLNPGVAFAAHNSGHGASDDLFTDLYGYFATVNSAGKPIAVVPTYHHKAGARVTAAGDGTFFIPHELPLDSAMNSDNVAERVRISRVDRDGKALVSRKVHDNPVGLWVGPFFDMHSVLYVLLADKSLGVYDFELNPVAEADSAFLGAWLGNVPISGEDKPCMVFANAVYSTDWERLLAGPIWSPTYFYGIETDAEPGHDQLVLARFDRSMIANVDHRSWHQLVWILLQRNQEFVLAVLASLGVALLLVSYFRWRTKKNLDVISEQKRQLEEAHERLKVMTRRAIEAERYKQVRDIAGGFAHEIRNALWPVEATVNVIKPGMAGTGDTTRVEKGLDRIANAARRAIALTRKISEYTQLDSAHHPEPVDVRTVLQQSIDELAGEIKSGGVRVNMSGVPQVYVKANSIQLAMAFDCLLRNSLDAIDNGSEGGEITIQGESAGETVNLQIADNGPGIPVEIRQRIFDPFFTTKPDRGTGLGLATVRQVVEMYGGSVELTDGNAQGTVFRLSLRHYPTEDSRHDNG